MLLQALDRFFKHEASGGLFLMGAALLAMIIANSALEPAYHDTLGAYLGVTINGNGIEKPLILWINDGLMAIFFFLIGLELKREILEGRLRNPADVILPGMAAVGGMVAPALIFLALNYDNPVTVHGWAIPAATDIAFALGVLALVGSRVPASLKVFLLTLAILDDLGAILIIALFYTADLQIDYLWLALIPFALMAYLNQKGAPRVAPTLLLGIVMWVFVLKSGVHATLAGVLTAFCIPLRDIRGGSPLHKIEGALSPYVFYVIVPIFAFANAGVVLEGLTMEQVFAPLTLGVAGGLVLGKQIGVLGVSWILVKLFGIRRPEGASWLQIYGIACLAGIGFTMSLFIGSLSFPDALHVNEVRLGILSGSAVSAILGYMVLRYSGSPAPVQTAESAGGTDPLAEK
ncbi:Na+/H+ antiporter NhaA [Mesobaculum littorinae]|uniref:Na(+)/H(+) antiporter NhaA n=1 Tax=Mesobaculum littorinae TaxID=2486419 RepID=A0A438AKP8_9RHOB|nr:Na+/H+ antiporter NhaA [Mesobaculum littorinae]RVV99401.1 Na+/H+ antiporter NhaA [Mesobaculum littorinae]